MANILILGAGAMGTAFAYPCIDNNHDISVIGTHLENNLINEFVKSLILECCSICHRRPKV